MLPAFKKGFIILGDEFMELDIKIEIVKRNEWLYPKWIKEERETFRKN